MTETLCTCQAGMETLGATPYHCFRPLFRGSDLIPTWPRTNQGKQQRRNQYTSTQAETDQGISTPTRNATGNTTHDTETRMQKSERTPRTHEPLHWFSRGWAPRRFSQIRAVRVQVLFGAYVVSCGACGSHLRVSAFVQV